MKKTGPLRRRPRALPFLAALFVSAAVGVFARPAPAPAASTALEHVGVLERYPADARARFGDEIIPPNHTDGAALPDRRNTYGGTIMVFPEVRQLWQFFFKGGYSGGTEILVRDLDTLAVTRSFHIDANLAPQRFKELPHALDPGKRIFLFDAEYANATEIDFRTFGMRVIKINPAGVPLGLAGAQFGGASYDAASDSLLMLYGQFYAALVANFNTYVTRVDLKTGALEVRLIRSCNGPLPSTDVVGGHGIGILSTPDYFYIPCQRAGMTGVVVRIPRNDAFLPISEEEVAVGPVQMEDALIDRQARRIFMATSPGELWAFDADSMSFVGVFSIMSSNTRFSYVSLGLDAESGRVYFLSQAYGLGVAEGRYFPLPQPRTEPAAAAPADERIWVDPNTRRVFVLKGTGAERARAYEIYRTDAPPVPPPPPDADANTADVDEQAGATDARFFANGSGYGARVILANGILPTVPAPSFASIAPTAQVLSKNIAPKCGFSDRDLIAGRVSKAEYDSAATAAEASAIAIDDRTKLDLDRPSRCDVTMRTSSELFSGVFATAPAVLDNTDAENPRWTIKPASCSANEGGDPATAESDDGKTRLGTSKVACPIPGGKLEASAFASLVGGVSVGRAYSDVKVYRDGKKGIRSEVISAAEEIDIAQGLIRIAEVKSFATSISNGRPQKSDMSTHRVLIRGVRVNGEEICKHDEQCDPNAVIDALNRVASGRAQFRIASGLDKRLLKGTPKGALTAVQKSVQRQSSDQALVGDFTTDVPALEMVVFNDNVEWGRARQLYQFAGVASSATYNISVIPTGTAGPEDSGTDLSDGLSESSETPPFLSTANPPGQQTQPKAPSKKRGIIEYLNDALTAVGRGIRMFFIDPRQSLLLLTGWAVFSMPGWLARRRRALVEARAE